MRVPAAWLLVLLVALTPVAAAQLPGPADRGVSFTADSVAAATIGGVVRLQLHATNGHLYPTTLALSVDREDRALPQLSASNVTINPGATATVTVTTYPSSVLSPGDSIVLRFHATESSVLATSNASHDAEAALHLVAAPVDALALSPNPLPEAHAAPNASAAVTATLQAPASWNASRRVQITLLAPPGWRTGSSNATLAPDSSHDATVDAHADANATDGMGRFVADDGHLARSVDVRFARDAPTPPPPPPVGGNGTLGNDTTGAPPPPAPSSNRTSNGSAPPPAPSNGAAPPPSNATSSPPPTTNASAAPTSPPRNDGPPPPRPASVTDATLSIRIEPQVLGLVPGGDGLAVAHVTWTGESDAVLSWVLELPAGFRASGLAPTVTLRAGSSADYAFRVRAAVDAPVGQQLGAQLAPDRATSASFSILVLASPVPPTVPLKLQSVGPDASPMRALVGASLVAALVGVVGLGVVWAHRRWGLGALALYSRIRKSRVLDHPTRAALHVLVTATPGATVAEAQRVLSLSNGQIEHHLRALERASLVRRVRDGNAVRLYDAATALRAPTAAPLGERVGELARDGRGPSEIARELGISRQLVHYHLRRGRVGTSR